jgi:hypothetical protein
VTSEADKNGLLGDKRSGCSGVRFIRGIKAALGLGVKCGESSSSPTATQTITVSH